MAAAYPKRAAAIVAEELNRAELARGVPEDEEEEQDSDYVSDEGEEAEGKKRSGKRRRRIVVVDGADGSSSLGGGVRLTEPLKRKAEEMFANLQKNHPALDQAKKLLAMMLREEFEEDPEGDKFRAKRTKRLSTWLDPMVQSGMTNTKPNLLTGEKAIEAVKEIMAKFGMAEVKEEVKFAGETIAVAKKVDKQVIAEQQMAKESRTGLDEMLDGISKKRGITTVEKSSYDWEKYKEEKNLTDELKDASKAGFVEKQAFLHRVDERQFETERAIRERERAKREANAPKKNEPS